MIRLKRITWKTSALRVIVIIVMKPWQLCDSESSFPSQLPTRQGRGSRYGNIIRTSRHHSRVHLTVCYPYNNWFMNAWTIIKLLKTSKEPKVNGLPGFGFTQPMVCIFFRCLKYKMLFFLFRVRKYILKVLIIEQNYYIRQVMLKRLVYGWQVQAWCTVHQLHYTLQCTLRDNLAASWPMGKDRLGLLVDSVIYTPYLSWSRYYVQPTTLWNCTSLLQS